MQVYEKSMVIPATVTGIEKYGIFVRVDDEYTGLIHISEMSDGFVRNVGDYVKVGDIIKVRIKDIDSKNHHLKLSIKKINYKPVNKNSHSIKETPLGFSTLEANLGHWIDETLTELKENEKK